METDTADGSEEEMETFLVQVFVHADDVSRGGDLHGIVRHVATGTETPFRNDAEVLGLLRRADAHPPLAPDQKENER